jgi:hypothetical protein
VVQVEAGLDKETRELIAKFVAVDPATGRLPEDPLVGLLYPNDETGRGLGSFTEGQKSNARWASCLVLCSP